MGTTGRGRRHRGGIANFKGSEFERVFGTYRVLVALRLLSRGGAVSLGLQLAGCSVDDWGEETRRSRRYYQLRRRRRQRWSDVREAFVRQLRQRVRGKQVTVVWVVASARQREVLRAAGERVPRVRVAFFPGWLRPEQHLRGGPARRALRSLCVEPLATPSDLEAIWKDVSLAWENVRVPGGFVPASAVMERLGAHAQLPIRHAWTAPTWWTRAERLLRRVPGLDFRVEGGHFFYRLGPGFQGRYACRSLAFRDFAERVIADPPRLVEQVRRLMSEPDSRLRPAFTPSAGPTSRHLTRRASPAVERQLAALQGARGSGAIAAALEQLGASLGAVVARRLGARPRPFALVCTPEDADSLVAGMLQRLPREHARLVCYWTDRSSHPSGDVATVIQSYVDPRLGPKVDTVVVAKAIISSGCIVRTSLERLLTEVSPSRIVIAAPVMVEGADKAVKEQFPRGVSSKFEFLTFAQDAAPIRGQGVRPGVGGQVEARLGLKALSRRSSPRLVQAWAATA